ncbi:myb-related transcription factor, partner of profilin-like [Phacochoerus africanus]|uniref:myb-related transcription factor, partner of profilin-like n=1 Tax=Phacochoerus africanus TaxID=41426 RepID=UPI001FD996A9|nr:myb-related transcription factor, partner of profilin-like [Phacochoerus africanus]
MPVTTLALSPVSRFPGPHQHPASPLWLRTCGGASELRAFSLGQGAGNPHIICLVHPEPRDTQQAPGTSQPDRQPRQAWKADVGPPGTPASPSAPPGPEGTETPPPCSGRVPRCSNCFRRGSASGGCFRHCDAGLTSHLGVSSGAGWRRGCQEERPGLCTPDLSGRACAPKSLRLALTPTLRPRAALSAAGAPPPDLLECVFSRDSCWHSPGSVSTCVLAPLTAIVTCQAGTRQGLCGSHHTVQQGLPGATERPCWTSPPPPGPCSPLPAHPASTPHPRPRPAPLPRSRHLSGYFASLGSFLRAPGGRPSNPERRASTSS